jgi:hypothetical protein
MAKQAKRRFGINGTLFYLPTRQRFPRMSDGYGAGMRGPKRSRIP